MTYEQYKDSGIDWIGQIPEHWEIRRFKYLFNEINERSIDGNEDLLSVSQYTGVTKKSDKIDDGDLLTNASTLEGYKKVRKHQLVSNIMLAWNGSLAFSEYNGITSPAYCIYELKHDDVYKYFHYLFKTDLYKSEFKRNSSGVIESRLRLYTDDFFSIWSVLPPIHEQEAIANFLDDKTAKIDALVLTKEQQIEKLKELRQAKIHHAVTKGLPLGFDSAQPPNGVEMKDSGIEWIGEIPKHWEVSKVKNYLEIPITDGPHTTPILLDEGIPFISAEAIKNGKIDFSKKRGNISEEDYQNFSQKYLPKRNDIYMIKSGATTGNVAMVETDDIFTIWSPLAVFRSNHRILPKFLFNVLQSSYFKTSVELSWSFGTQQNIGMGVLSNLIITIPISLEEQEQIVAYLDEVTGKIDQAIAQKQEQITKLKEYKQSLINEVVTGKVKVCG